MKFNIATKMQQFWASIFVGLIGPNITTLAFEKVQVENKFLVQFKPFA